MKKYAIFLITITTFFMISSAFSQDELLDRPKYKITAKQDEVLLGSMVIELFPEIAPKHCRNFDSLVSIKFYDGTAFHRVIPGFMIQGGDPNSKNKTEDTWGYGDPSQTKVPAEFSSLNHKRGILSAARAQDPNSATSQFFICVQDSFFLDGKYTIFGQVIQGMDVADKIVKAERNEKDRPLKKIEMTIEKISD